VRADPVILRALSKVVEGLTEADLVETVDVGGLAWMVFVQELPARAGHGALTATVALRLVRGQVVVGYFGTGKVPIDRVRLGLHEARA